MAKLYGKKYPSADKIWSRTSTVARSMASTLMPVVKPESNSSMLDNKDNCVYCGAKANHLDHLYPLVENKYPSGYCTEPVNLVPCCGSCNQSKGAKYWYNYMNISNYISYENLTKFLLSKLDDNNLNDLLNKLIEIQLKIVLKVLTKNQLIELCKKKEYEDRPKGNPKKEILISFLAEKQDLDKERLKLMLDSDKKNKIAYNFIYDQCETAGELQPLLNQLNSASDDLNSSNNIFINELFKVDINYLLYDYLKSIIEDKSGGNKMEDSEDNATNPTKKEMDSNERILRRLLIYSDKTTQTDLVKDALESLNKRKENLQEYCIKNNLPTPESSENKHKLRFFAKENIRNWWDGMYNEIKNSLSSAQIQIDAFNEGIRTCLEKRHGQENQTTDDLFKDYFIQLLKAEKKKGEEAVDKDLLKLHALGFSICANNIVINNKPIEELIDNEDNKKEEINDKIKPSVNIYKGAKIAFIMGYNYCNGLGSDNENIRKLYL